MSGKRLIQAVKEAAAGNIARIHFEGETWVRLDDNMDPHRKALLDMVRDETIGPAEIVGAAVVFLGFHGPEEKRIADAVDAVIKREIKQMLDEVRKIEGRDA